MRQMVMQARSRLRAWGMPEEVIPHVDLAELDEHADASPREKDKYLRQIVGDQAIRLLLHQQSSFARGSSPAAAGCGCGHGGLLTPRERTPHLSALPAFAAMPATATPTLPMSPVAWIPLWLWEILKAAIAALVAKFGWEGFKALIEGQTAPQPVTPPAPVGPDPTGATGSPAGPQPIGTGGVAGVSSGTAGGAPIVRATSVQWHEQSQHGQMKKCTAINVAEVPAGYKTCIVIWDNGEYGLLWDDPGKIVISKDGQQYKVGYGDMCVELIGPGVFTAHLESGEDWASWAVGQYCPCDN